MRRRSRGWVWIVMPLLALSCMSGAQTWAGGYNGEHLKLEVWPTVGVDVRILDRHDLPAKDISVEHLIVREDGKEIAGARLWDDTEPQSVCLLQDTSGSTFDSRKTVEAELDEILRDLPVDDEVCHISFSEKPILELGLSGDRHRLAEVIKYQRSAGGSAMLDALKFAALHLSQRAIYASRVIVFVGDGGDNLSGTTADELRDLLCMEGAPTIFALVNRGYSTSGHSGGERKQLEGLVEASGGMAYSPKDPASGKDAAKDLIAEMGTRYRLEFDSNDRGRAGSHAIDIKVDKDLAKQKFKVLAQRGINAAE